MNKLKKGLPFILAIIFVLSVGLFAANHGFKYSDYEDSIKVSVAGNNGVSEFLDKLKDTTGLIVIDRNDNVAYYQHIDKNAVDESINNIKKDYPDISKNIQSVYSTASKKDKVINTALIGLAIITLFIGYSYVITTRKFSWNLKDYAKYYGVYILDNIISVGILGGIVSALSLVYKINDYILYSFFFLLIFKTLIFWFKLLQEDISKMKLSYVENFKNDYRKLFTIAFVLIVLLSVGIGVKSVLPLGLFLAALIISVLCDYSVLTFELPKFRKTLSKIDKVTKVKQPVIDVASVKKYVPNPKLKKKNKRK